MAKWRHGRYATEGTATSWMKIKNAAYSQMEGRHELFAASKQATPGKSGAPDPSTRESRGQLEAADLADR